MRAEETIGRLAPPAGTIGPTDAGFPVELQSHRRHNIGRTGDAVPPTLSNLVRNEPLEEDEARSSEAGPMDTAAATPGHPPGA